MTEMTPQGSELLEKALALSHERGLLIDYLIESLHEGPAEEGVAEAWDEEIKRRVDDIRSGRVELIDGEQVLRELAQRSRQRQGLRSQNALPQRPKPK
jgi:hypothetical protein